MAATTGRTSMATPHDAACGRILFALAQTATGSTVRSSARLHPLATSDIGSVVQDWIAWVIVCNAPRERLWITSCCGLPLGHAMRNPAWHGGASRVSLLHCAADKVMARLATRRRGANPSYLGAKEGKTGKHGVDDRDHCSFSFESEWGRMGPSSLCSRLHMGSPSRRRTDHAFV